ncbi:MAG: YHYH protein [Ignavibacteria bacterium]|nr:YHYH protein [Ignavibacteria bacterium]
MKTLFLVFIVVLQTAFAAAQTNPAITSWMQNTTVTARHYVKGNSTPIEDAALVNVQKVQYSDDFVYVSTTGLPSYVTGPFLDGNPSLATNQNAIFKLPLKPLANAGTVTATKGGNIGIFVNGVALFDYRDGVAWNANTNSLCGGPGNPPCPGGMGSAQPWNRDAIVAERGGFDCAKAHPAMGNYHHHQNPSAFNLDLVVISTICNLYNADGLYAMDSTKHSPLLGFAYDGFPIYGAYGFKNADGSGGLVRIKSSYTLRDITVRNTSPTGATVTAGAPINATYPLGYFREDYQYNATSAATPDYLDEHNGRFCVTPEYPNGIYCYFTTVDANWNSTYPYVIGPTFYGKLATQKVTSITEPVTTYTSGAKTLTVSPSAVTIDAAAGSKKTFDIVTTVAWTLAVDEPWVSADKTSGIGSATITLTALQNSDPDRRATGVTVVGEGVPMITVAVTQLGTAPTLAVSKAIVIIKAPANSTGTFEISSNTNWTISGLPTWLSASTTTGNGNATITLTAQENSTGSPRTASFSVSITGQSAAVTVTQETITLGVDDESGLANSVSVFPNPSTDIVAIQLKSINTETLNIELFDITGRVVQKTALLQGSTIAYFDTRTLYSGEYLIRIYSPTGVVTKKFTLLK